MSQQHDMACQQTGHDFSRLVLGLHEGLDHYAQQLQDTKSRHHAHQMRDQVHRLQVELYYSLTIPDLTSLAFEVFQACAPTCAKKPSCPPSTSRP